MAPIISYVYMAIVKLVLGELLKMKTNEELKNLKEEVENLNKKFVELNENDIGASFKSQFFVKNLSDSLCFNLVCC